MEPKTLLFEKKTSEKNVERFQYFLSKISRSHIFSKCGTIKLEGLNFVFGNYLKFERDKFRITEWYNKIMFALMKSFENAYDDLDNLAYSKNIFGLSDNETFDSETSDNN